MKKRCVRSVAILLTMLFTFEHVYAMPFGVQPVLPSPLGAVDVCPATWGTVQETWQGGNEGHVYLIEDMHSSPRVQQTIASLTTHILENTPIDFVGVEGYSGDLRKRVRSIFQNVPEKNGRRAVAQFLLEKGEMTGPQYASISSRLPFSLIGLEQRADYSAHLEQLTLVKDARTRMLPVINAIRTVLQEKRYQLYPQDVRSLDTLFTAMRNQKEITYDELCAQLLLVMERRKMALAPYPLLERLSQHKELPQSVRAENLIEEIYRAWKDVRERFLSGEARLLSEFSDLYEMLFMMCTLSCTSKDSETISRERSVWYERLTFSYGWLRDHHIGVDAEGGLPTQEEFFSLCDAVEQFYARAHVRDISMAQTLWKHLMYAPSHRALAVVGGFHTTGMTRFLREFNVSYTVIRPRLIPESIEGSGDYYDHGNAQLQPLMHATLFLSQKLLLENFITDETTSLTQKECVVELLAQLLRAPYGVKQSVLLPVPGTPEKIMLLFEKMQTEKGDAIDICNIHNGKNGVLNFGAQGNVEWLEKPRIVESVIATPAANKAEVPSEPAVPVQPLVLTSRLPQDDMVAYAHELRQLSLSQRYQKGRFVEEHAAALKDYTVASLQFEAGLDRGLIDQLIQKYGEKVTRFTGQLTMTGGLGALMHDLVVGWRKNGVDVISINPLYNNRIKGTINFMEDTPQGVNSLGDMVRSVLSESEVFFNMTLHDNEFRGKANHFLAREAMEKNIHIQIYQGKSLFTDAPLYYIDAYYMYKGEKIYIFDELYPDDDRRVVQMAVYNYASQKLLKLLQLEEKAQNNIVFVENEVFVSLPKTEFPQAITHNINHTVYAPGLYRPPAYAFNLLGFDERIRQDIVRHNDWKHIDEIDIVSYISKARAVQFITGVGLVEHTPVLKESVFPFARHKVWEYNENSMRNTNGALFDMWQGPELRILIDTYKERLGIDLNENDSVFYAALRQDTNAELKIRFMRQFSMVKDLYAYQLYRWLEDFQQEQFKKGVSQVVGGAEWLSGLLEGTPYERRDHATLEKELQNSILRMLRDVTNDEVIKTYHKDFGLLAQRLHDNPLVSNVRRQVPYKGPDKYKELFELFSRMDSQELKAFRESKTRLIIGGRMFGDEATNLFYELQRLVVTLNLESQVAFIENYNISDAPMIFRGVTGTVMLSDEFLEASATSMMKALPNGALLLGVWGGAMPELFTLVRTKDNAEINVFDFVKQFGDAKAHDELVSGLRMGKYRIANGFLVEYKNGELSGEKVEGKTPRRPSVESLLHALISCGKVSKIDHMREDYQFEALASSPRVDIERSQARAHILLWQQAITEREDREEFLLKFENANPQDVYKALYENGKGFTWRYLRYGYDDETVFQSNAPGLIGFFNGYREAINKGIEGYWSLCYHVEKDNGGDILAYLRTILDDVPTMAPLKEKIIQYIEEKNGVNTTEERVIITLKALDLVHEVISRHCDFLKQSTPGTITCSFDSCTFEPVIPIVPMVEMIPSEFHGTHEDGILHIVLDYTKVAQGDKRSAQVVHDFLQTKNAGRYKITLVVPEGTEMNHPYIKDMTALLGSQITAVVQSNSFANITNVLINEHVGCPIPHDFVVISQNNFSLKRIENRRDVRRVSIADLKLAHYDQRLAIIFAFFDGFLRMDSKGILRMDLTRTAIEDLNDMYDASAFDQMFGTMSHFVSVVQNERKRALLATAA